MCIHSILISEDTGILIESSTMKRDDLIDNTYICNGCGTLFMFKDGVLVKERRTEMSA